MYNEWFKLKGNGNYRSLKDKAILDELQQEFAVRNWDVQIVKTRGDYYFKNVKAAQPIDINPTYVPITI